MSWSRRRLLVGALVALAAGAAGCGFQPLYAPVAAGAPGSPDAAGPEALAGIQIARIPNRTGQLIYDVLRDRLNPRGEPADPQYRLRVRTATGSEGIALRPDAFATRVNLRLTGTWELISVEDSKVVAQGTVRSVAGYDSGSAPFATAMAREDAQARAASEVGVEIAARLALFFRRHAEGLPVEPEERVREPSRPLFDRF